MIPTIQWSQLFDDPLANYDPQFFDDPQLFDDQLEVWTLIIQKSTVIHPSRMVLFIVNFTNIIYIEIAPEATQKNLGTKVKFRTKVLNSTNFSLVASLIWENQSTF